MVISRVHCGIESFVFHYCYILILGRLVNVRIVEYTIEKTFEQEVRYIASFIGKYVEVDTHVKEVIEKYVSDRLRDLDMEKFSAVVMWWQLEKGA